MLRNIFALIGLLALILLGVSFVKTQDLMAGFDPQAAEVYMELAENVLKSKNAANAMVWKVPVAEGISADDVEQAMEAVAVEVNMANVGELPTSKDIEAKSGKPYRLVKIFLFCNSLVAARMMDYDDAFSAYLPCRITLIEDKQGKLWLMALNMDLMIYGGAPLPADLKAEALRVKEKILSIMNRGAKGEF